MRDTADVVRALARAGVGGVSATQLTRSLYASDASLHRVEPLAVAVPRHRDEVVAAASVCRELGVALTLRGAGTSIAGNAIGPGVVLDTSRHLTAIGRVDPEAGTAVVEPGVVHAQLQRAVAAYGWRFGPDPSTHDRATIGGMVGNNACGSRALGYGRTADNVVALEVVTGSGELMDTARPHPVADRVAALVDANLAAIRTEFGRFGRQVSGYSLEHLLPEQGRSLARFLVGTEGTLATTLQATVRLVRDEPVRLLVALGYPSMPEAADAVPAVLAHRPIACEGLDKRIVDRVTARRGPSAVPRMPRGAGWLLVELAGESHGEVLARAQALVREAGALAGEIVTDPAAAAALWRIREDGAGLSSRSPAGKPAHAGWEDAAVPPAHLGAYLRDFDELLLDHDLTGLPYGHLGDGCLHIRVDVPLDRPGGRAAYRDFLEAAARLTARHGGSFSGEHGDGRARSELLPLMYSPAAMALFAQVKGIFDPDARLNPGIVVDPAPLDADLRIVEAQRHRVTVRTPFGLPEDGNDLLAAVHRCTGVGKCQVDNRSRGGAMCPSYQATGELQDGTRGRARVLQDAVAGHLGPDPWGHPALLDALELCLSCKACASECPTGVDIAAYKAIALHERYRGKRRPLTHYTLGRLPDLVRLARPVSGIVNALLRRPRMARVLARAAGIDSRRPLPALAEKGFRRWFAERTEGAAGAEVVLFVDSFSEGFSTAAAQATVAVLEAAGYRPLITQRQVCCGLTLISTGQLDRAASRARELVDELLPHARAGRRIVGVEPSCLATIRDDVPRLVPGEDARTVAAMTRTLAELLTETPGWRPPDLTGTTVVAQPHCHQQAILGWDSDAALLRGAGAEVARLTGCCGLAGNFGAERGHHDLSLAIAQSSLVPGIARAGPDATVLADGFSCRTQVAAAAPEAQGRTLHLAQLLARRLDGAQ